MAIGSRMIRNDTSMQSGRRELALTAPKENDLAAGLPKLCLALEQDRRTPEGRIRSPQEFREHYFRYDEGSSTDLIFNRLPGNVRGPILSAWGIRGPRMAVNDSDEKVQSVVHDAFLAGDIDDALFEQGLDAELVVRWTDAADWWKFWRGGALGKHAIQKALEVSYELKLFDARWFFDALGGGGGKARGTELLSEGLSKSDLTEWIKNVHQSGDGSPKGLLAALGWSTIVARTRDELLTMVLDAFAVKAGMAATPNGRGAEVSKAPTVSASPAAAIVDETTSDIDGVLAGIDDLAAGNGGDPISVRR
jgi:hypothetical protein